MFFSVLILLEDCQISLYYFYY